MADLSQGSFANVVLNAGESVRVITSGTATVESKYGAPAGTTTVTANSQVFGPYLVPAKLRVTAVTGSLSYVQGSRVPVTQDPITGEFQPSVSGAWNEPGTQAWTVANQSALWSDSSRLYIDGAQIFVLANA